MSSSKVAGAGRCGHERARGGAWRGERNRRWTQMRCGACAERGARREACAVAYVDFHLTVETVAEQKVVRHTDAMRLHRVALAVVVLAGHSGKRTGIGQSGSALRGQGIGGRHTRFQCLSRRNRPPAACHQPWRWSPWTLSVPRGSAKDPTARTALGAPGALGGESQ